MNPVSPYAISKHNAHKHIQAMRDQGLFACSGILFNHESPRRGKEFVTRKITYELANIAHGRSRKIHLGNLNAKRDWGFAPDYVRAIWLMMQQEEPDDYVIATGKNHTILELLHEAAKHFNIDRPERYITIDSSLYRPQEVNDLCGDATFAKAILGWEPTTTFEQLIKIMAESDDKLVQSEIAQTEKLKQLR